MRYAVIQLVDLIFTIIYWLLVARVFLSWINPDPYNSLVRFIYRFTEPILAPFRRLVPPSPGMPIDFSPILAFFALWIVKRLVFAIMIPLLF